MRAETGELQPGCFRCPNCIKARPIDCVAQLRNWHSRVDTVAALLTHLPVSYQLAATAFAGALEEDMAGSSARKSGTRNANNVGNSRMADGSVLDSSLS